MVTLEGERPWPQRTSLNRADETFPPAHRPPKKCRWPTQKQKIDLFNSYKKLLVHLPQPQFLSFKSYLIMRSQVLAAGLFLLAILWPLVRGQCSDRLLQYQVTLKTHWAEEDFPKAYPKFRPPAQWSKLVGRTHGGNFSIFRVGGFASGGLKKFVETGSSDMLDELALGNKGVFDTFTAPGIPKGVGEVTTNFFVDGAHSKVSLLSRIVPSPDWFVGIDSLDLCLKGQEEWVRSLSVQVDAIDAGTDNGYTYTAPRWPSVPQEAVYQITPETPSHPAGSFYYPDRDRNPPLATFTFVIVSANSSRISKRRHKRLRLSTPHQLKEYSMAWDDNVVEPYNNNPAFEDLETNDWGNELREGNELGDGEIFQVRATKKRRYRKSKGRDCIVSKWTEWSDCTSKTCEMAEQYRTRSIVSHPRSGGLACLPLLEKRLCMPDRDCRQNYFDWLLK